MAAAAAATRHRLQGGRACASLAHTRGGTDGRESFVWLGRERGAPSQALQTAPRQSRGCPTLPSPSPDCLHVMPAGGGCTTEQQRPPLSPFVGTQGDGRASALRLRFPAAAAARGGLGEAGPAAAARLCPSPKQGALEGLRLYLNPNKRTISVAGERGGRVTTQTGEAPPTTRSAQAASLCRTLAGECAPAGWGLLPSKSADGTQAWRGA